MELTLYYEPKSNRPYRQWDKIVRFLKNLGSKLNFFKFEGLKLNLPQILKTKNIIYLLLII